MTNVSELLELLERREAEIADPPQQAVDEVWRAIQARIATGQPAPELDTGALIGGASKPGAALLKLVGGGALVALIGLGLGIAAMREPPGAPPVEAAPVQTRSVEAPPVARPAEPARLEAPPAQPAAVVSTTPSPSTPSRRPAVEPRPSDGPAKRSKLRAPEPEPEQGPRRTLADEIALAGRISSELKQGAWKRTLRLVAEHERDFPDGELVEERHAAKARALCHVGSGEAGREEADAFARRWPTSIHLAVVRRDCEGI